ncbi:MAG: protein kinase [Sumerlaeia bacterium]
MQDDGMGHGAQSTSDEANDLYETFILGERRRHSSHIQTETRLLAPKEGNSRNHHQMRAENSQQWLGYRLLSRLGQGGMGEVWQAVQQNLSRLVAVKRLRPDIDEIQADYYTNLFLHEAVTTAQLDHPNIIPAYELGEDEEGRPLLAMKMVRGQLWPEVMDFDAAVLPQSEYLATHLRILLDVAQATAFAHSRGIVHRDLKPQQVIVGDFGEVYLTDWGLAVLYDKELLVKSRYGLDPPELPSIDSAPNPAGTPAFMAPEQADSNSRRIGPWTDVYLLGATLYRLLCGTAPRDPAPYERLLGQIEKGLYVPLSHRKDCYAPPHELAELVEEAMAFEPERRPTAKGFISRLEEYVTGAGARRDSNLIMEKVQKFAESESQNDYDYYGDLISEISRAIYLWPDNKKAIEMKDLILLRFVELALDRGDLSLAEVQADRILEEEHRTEAAALVKAAQLRQKAAQRTQRVLWGMTALLVALILMGTLFFNRQLSHRTTLAESATSDARAAQAELLTNQEQLNRQLYINSLAIAEGYLVEHQPIAARQELLAARPEFRNLEWGLLYAQSVPEAKQISLDLGAIVDIAASRDGKSLLVCNEEGQSWIVDYFQDQAVPVNLGPDVAISAVAISPDGVKQAYGCQDGTVFLQVQGERAIRLSNAVTEGVARVAFGDSGERLGVLSTGGELLVLEVETGAVVWRKVLDAHTEQEALAVPKALTWGPGEGLIAAADKNYQVILLDSQTGEETTALAGHVAPVRSISFLGEGERLVSGGEDGQVLLWTLDSSGEEVERPSRLQINQEIDERAYVVKTLPFASQSGQLVVTVSANGYCSLLDSLSGAHLWEAKGHQHALTSAALIEARNMLVTASEAGKLTFWRVAEDTTKKELDGHFGRVVVRGVTPDGTRALTFAHDNTARVWDIASGREVLQVELPMGRYAYAEGRLSSDGSCFAAISKANQPQLYKMEDGGLIASSPDCEVDLDDIALASDNDLYAIGGELGFVSLGRFREEQGEDLVLETPDANVTSVEFSPDGQIVAAAFRDRSIWLYETSQGKVVRQIEGAAGWAETLAFSPAGNRLLAAGFDGDIREYNLEDGELLKTLIGHQGWVSEAIYSPDGRRIVSVSPGDNTIRVWTADTGNPLMTYRGLAGPGQSLALTPDSSRLVVTFNNLPSQLLEIAPWNNSGSQLPVWQRQQFELAASRRVDSQRDSRVLWLAPLAKALEARYGEAINPPLVPLISEDWDALRNRQLRILCEAPKATEASGKNVYITGNRPELASWKPCLVALEPLVSESQKGSGLWEYSVSFRLMEFKFNYGERGEDWATSQEWGGPPNRAINYDSPLLLDRHGNVVYASRFGLTDEEYREELMARSVTRE